MKDTLDYNTQLVVFLTEDQHRHLRRIACESDRSMSDVVRDWVDGEAVKAPKISRKPTQEAPKVVQTYVSEVKPVKPAVDVSAPSLDLILGEKEVSKCKKCFESFPVADMVTEPKSGKLYCKDCVDNMRNAQ